MTTAKRDKTPRHPIGVVSRRTGLAQDLIRAWERRYGVVIPGRTATGRRLYSDEDVRRLLLLKRLVDGGRRISDVAGLKLADLETMVEEDREAVVEAPARVAVDGQAHLEAAIEAAVRLDRAKIEGIFAEAAVSMSAPEMRQKLIAPLLLEIGERWRQGTVRVAHEHLASSIVRAFVESTRNRSHDGGDRPRIVITTPSGQQHELGALMAAAAAEEVGWEAIYLGASLPAEEIGAAVRHAKARAVGVSVVYGEDKRMTDELRAIRRYVGDDIEFIVGGRAAANAMKTLDDIDAHHVTDLLEFQSRLDSIRVGGE